MTAARAAVQILLIAGALMAQAPSNPAASVKATVSGVAKEAGTGKPLPDFTVVARVTDRSRAAVKTATDEQGRYRLTDLPPGKYIVAAANMKGMFVEKSRRVTLGGGDVDGIDFTFTLPGAISGRVVDENREPMPDMWIFLVSREYYLGTLGYFLRAVARTDDRGRYTLERVAAGQPHLVMAESREMKLPAHSEAPLNPKLRRPVPLRTYYPNSPSREGAAALILSSGERREGVDIEIRKSPSYCIAGTLIASGGPAALDFSIETQQPSSGWANGRGTYVVSPRGKTGPDGKFRICDLAPGLYRMTAVEWATSPGGGQPPNYGVAFVTIVDEDLRDIKIAASPGTPLEGEVVWEATPPEKPVKAQVAVRLDALLRSRYLGENTYARSDVPGSFSFPSLLIDDYVVEPTLNAPGLYIKDVTYDGRSIRHAPLRLGSAMAGAGLKIVVAHDGAELNARVSDKDGNPVADMYVLSMPADVTTEAMLAARMVTGQTDQSGQYASSTLAPGKYYVAATGQSFDATPESIGRLWRSRSRFKEVELPPNGKAQLSLEPVNIE